MNPGTPFHFLHHRAPNENGAGFTAAAIIAVLFAAVAAISFAVDQSVTLSNASAPPAYNAGR